MKKRVLFVTENGFVNSGYGRYSFELFKELHKYYDLAELGVNAGENNRDYQNYKNSVPWKVYPGLPSNQEQQEEFNRTPLAQKGMWGLSYALLDFQCDCLCDNRDAWDMVNQNYHPFRDHYSWVIMPAVDGWPQQPSWMNFYKDAEAMISYTNWGKNILEEKSHGRIKPVGIAPIIMPEEYRPLDKKPIELDGKVIGNVMRNQRRKLFDQLMTDFAEIKKRYHSKVYLYLHTNPVDGGWQPHKYLHEKGLGDSVLFTYICSNCKQMQPHFYNGQKIACQCGHFKSIAGTGNGVSVEQMNAIYNSFDLYVQMSTIEGLGISPFEAAATGCPTMTMKWTGQEDAVNDLGSIPYDFFTHRELESGRYFAHPKSEDFIEKALKQLDEPFDRKAIAAKTRSIYTKENVVNTWRKAIDSTSPKKPWNSTPKLINPQQIPDSPLNSQWVRNAIIYYMQRHDLIGSLFEKRMIRDLNDGLMRQTYGFYWEEVGFDSQLVNQPFNREIAVQCMNSIINYNNEWEQRRWSKLKNI